MSTPTARHRATRRADPEALDAGRPAEAPRQAVRQIFRRFRPYTAGFRGRIALGLVLAVLSPLPVVASLWLFAVLVDDVLTPGATASLPWVAGAILAVTLLGAILDLLRSAVSAWTAEQYVLALRTSVFAHLHRLSPGFFERRPLGDVLSRLGADVEAVERLVLT
uniref:ABC transporter transmembrane domain-containing protein n=1 Tax=Pseudonocardia pini TaxID=2758030 RepID=UPI001FE57F85